MGRRRQSPDTDPGRDDDAAKIRTRSLEVSAADISEGLNAVEDGDGARPDA
jgi:hypothetical protein